MKKAFSKILLSAFVISAGFAFSACSSDDNDTPAQKYVTVSINLSDELNLSDLKNLQLTAVNNTLGKSYTLTYDTAGVNAFKLPQGSYSFSFKSNITSYTLATGVQSADIFSDTTSVSIPVSLVKQSPLIFKTIYNAGSKMGYVRDTYFEIVNNGDSVEYLDGLILAAPQGRQSAANEWQAEGVNDLYNSGQGPVLAFPGTGKDHPIQPGQTIVIANNAVNHAEASGNASSPDLSKADWEIYLDYSSQEVDNPDVPNLDVLFTNNKFMASFALGFFGRAFILAKLPDGMDPATFAADSANIQTTPGTKSNIQFLMIPSKYVLDAVDVWDGSQTTHYSTFLSRDDAAGVISATAWSGLCERRKTVVRNGRTYYQDTNNSSEDFLTDQPLKEN